MKWPDWADFPGPGSHIWDSMSVIVQNCIGLRFTGSGVTLVDHDDGTCEVQIAGGGGGSQTLADTLALGNDANGLGIVNLLDPVDDQDAATKKYVDDNSGGGLLLSATVTLTDAQIKALPTTGVAELVAAPGAGKKIVPSFATITCDTSANPYANVDAACYMPIALGNDDVEFLSTIQNYATASFSSADTLLSSGGPRSFLLAQLPGAWAVVGAAFTPQPIDGGENEALNLFCDNGGSGDFTGGDPANSLTVTVFYVVVDV